MVELENKKRSLIEQQIKNQAWFDYLKLTYPVDMDKVINDYSEKGPDRKLKFIDPAKIIRYQDLCFLAGEKSINDLVRYFAPVTPEDIGIDFNSLTDKEINEIEFILENFPFTEIGDIKDFFLTDIIRKTISISRGLDVLQK